MARSDYVSPDLLRQWRIFTEQNAWKFNQVSVGGDVPHDKYLIWIQSERDVIARGLQTAYDTMRKDLNYPIRPEYFVDEWIKIPKRNCALSDQTLYTSNAHLEAFGTRATTLIEAGATINYSDSTGSGTNDTGTVTVTTSTAIGEIQVFFTVTDGADSDANETWQIPATVTRSGVDAIITFDRYDCVKPSIWDAPYTAPNYENDGRNGADSSDASDFITTVDVYRVYTDTTDAVQVVTGIGSGAPTYTTVTPIITDKQAGEFVITGSGSHAYGQVVASYKAGHPLDRHGNIDTELLTATIRLANVNMALVPPTSSRENLVNRVWLADQTDISEGFNERIALGMAYKNEVVSRRKNYVGGYSA